MFRTIIKSIIPTDIKYITSNSQFIDKYVFNFQTFQYVRMQIVYLW